VLKFKVLLLICVVVSTGLQLANSQVPKKLTSGEIYQQMEKLGFLEPVPAADIPILRLVSPLVLMRSWIAGAGAL